MTDPTRIYDDQHNNAPAVPQGWVKASDRMPLDGYSDGLREIADELDAVQKDLAGIELQADGNANFYWLMRDGKWIAKIQMNGEMLVDKQVALLEAMLSAGTQIAHCPKCFTCFEVGSGSTEQNPWRDAVIEQLESWHICVPAIHDNSPRLAIKALVNIETKAALDPAVSSEAAALVAGQHNNAPAVPQDNDPEWTLAAKVREALDREACPGYYMDVAVEAVVHNYIYATSAQPAQRAPYTTIDLGHGKFEVGAGKNGGLPCIAFGRNGTGKVGEPITTGPRQMSVEETFAVITFANVTGLDVLQEKMDQVREEFFPGTTPQFSATPAPAPAQEVGLTDGEPAHGAGLLEQRRELDAIEFFESTNRDSYEFKKSVRGIYANPAVARDWKWFQLGMKHATEDES